MRNALWTLALIVFAGTPSAWAGSPKDSSTQSKKACKSESIDILLTNDDGFARPGIRELRSALIAAGYNVKLVGPKSNFSGASTSLTLTSIRVEEDPIEAEVYSVEGTPATTVLLGVSAIFGSDNPPDLVISGINEGANIGPFTVASGTVGATIAGLQLLEPSIPGIAVSTDLPATSEPPDSPTNRAHFAQVAEFTARLVDELRKRACRNDTFLTQDISLNVNYPPLPQQEVEGVLVREQGQVLPSLIGFAETSPGSGIFVPTFSPNESAETDVPRSDTIAYREGFVTIVPLDGDYTAKPATQAHIEFLLQNLKP